MKILYTNFHAGAGGGHTTYVVALARALAARHEVHVAAPGTSALIEQAAAIPGVTALAQAFPNGLRRWRERGRARAALARVLREGGYDIVHVNGSADHRLVLAAMRGLPARPRVVLTKHNSKPTRGPGHWWRARHTDRVIAVSASTGGQLEQSAYRRCGIDVVHNGIDLRRFTPVDADAARAARGRWLEDESALLVGSNAGTAPYKGWMDAVEALALLDDDRRARIRLVVAGHVPPAAQQARIAQLGLQGHVHFPGLMDDVRPLIAALDAGFVLSWDVETISFACREMMAMGTPVLATEFAGLPENIEAGIDGWLVPVRDPPAIARVLCTMLDDRARVAAMGVAAHARAQREFGLEPFVTGTEAVYRRALGR